MARRKRAFLMEKENMITAIFKDGKTFLIAATIVMIGVTEGLFGFDVPGVVVGPDWLAWVLTGLGLGTLREAIRKLMSMFSGN